MLIWSVTVFNMALIGYLVVNFSNVYGSAIASSAADIIANIVAGVLFAMFSLKKIYIGAFTLSTISGVVLWIWGL